LNVFLGLLCPFPSFFSGAGGDSPDIEAGLSGTVGPDGVAVTVSFLSLSVALFFFF
jgi:hypothetical protein